MMRDLNNIYKGMKKDLSDQQQRRIHQQFAKRVQHAESKQGLVISHYRKHVDVEDETGVLHRCYMRGQLGALGSGDNVLWEKQKDEGIITAILPRKSEFFRYNKFTGNKLIASNIDQIFIVTACEPPRALNLIDRFLVLAELQNIPACIIFNKVDIVNDELLTSIKHNLNYYEKLGYPVFYTSTITSASLKTLQHALSNKSSIFVGLSGVGKSSLINALIPTANLLTGRLSEGSSEGNHTTTTARLMHLPNGGDLIDCPGVREVSVGELDKAELIQGFIELKTLAKTCRFRNCHHQDDPGCAINAAIQRNEINPDRLASYLNLLNTEED